MVVDTHNGFAVELSTDLACVCGPHKRSVFVSSTNAVPGGLMLAATIDGKTTHVVLTPEEAVSIAVALLRTRSLEVNGHG